MNRQTRERIIAAEVKRLEERQARERAARRRAGERSEDTAAPAATRECRGAPCPKPR